MYTTLLDAAFGVQHQAHGEQTLGEALEILLRCRSRLETGVEPNAGIGWAPEMVADQLAYDVALVALARLAGIDCEIASFDPPQDERARLQDALVSRGVPLEDFVS